MVVDGDLSVLVLSGKPLLGELESAKMEVLAEFAELSGNDATTAAMSVMAKIYEYRAQRLSYIYAMFAMEGGFESGKEFFKNAGFDVSGWSAENPNRYLKRINAEIKAVDTKIALKVKEYNSMAANRDGKAITEKDIRTEMAVLSKNQGHAVGDDCNLATYAGYRQSYNIYVKSLEDAKFRTDPR
jgi:hypothetical protein